MNTDLEIYKIIDRLLKLPKECEWAEFKVDNSNPQEIGHYISALSNGANLNNEPYGYLVYGIKDVTHEIVGTKFRPKENKEKGQELEHWLLLRLSPRIDILIYETIYNGVLLSLFQIQAAKHQPTAFEHKEYIRIGSIKRDLREFPEKEKKIWNKGPKLIFEKGVAKVVDNANDIIKYLDTQNYFELIGIPYPTTQNAVIQKFESENFIVKTNDGYNITNLGGILFAKDLQKFDTLKRKAIRVVKYEGKGKMKALKEQEGQFGYASSFERLIKYVLDLLPSNEIIKHAFRETISLYPEIAIRELIANAIIHQDFDETGTSPMIEIYDDRIEISNPGLPLIITDRFIDECQSRNESLAAMMRRFRICEERGSGMDKVVNAIEMYQLPAYDIQVQQKHTKVILYAHLKFGDMDKKDRVRACYQHCCLKYVMNEKMSNQSLRERFQIADENAAMVSRIIKDTVEGGFIKEEDPDNKSRKFVKYIPIWA